MNIDTQVDFRKGRLAPAENMATAVGEMPDPHIKLPGIEIHCIKIIETENNYVEYYGN